MRSSLRVLVIPIVALALPALDAQAGGALPDYVIAEFGAPPAVPDGPLSDRLQRAIRLAFVESIAQSSWGAEQSDALAEIAASGDPRVAWLVSDMMRFVSNARLSATLADAAADLLGIAPPSGNQWEEITNHLIAWEIPAPPDYLAVKRAIFTSAVPGWERLFVEGDIDWRLVSWGGVLIDDRPFGRTDEPCNCIPAADDPEVSTAAEATWLDDEDIVFGIVVNGEARAYPWSAPTEVVHQLG
jgi:DNA-binding transcriptional regulator YdaS (Cro superfamily)